MGSLNGGSELVVLMVAGSVVAVFVWSFSAQLTVPSILECVDQALVRPPQMHKMDFLVTKLKERYR
jgi:hypothetical protein